MSNQKPGLRKHHQNRDDLIGEHPLGDIGQMILLMIFIIVLILDSFVLKFSIFSLYLPLEIRITLGIMILTISGIFARLGLNIVFGETRTNPHVISKGVFKIVRHPVYFSAILFYLSLIIFTFSFSALILWLIIILFYFHIARYEEQLLIKRFGDEYRYYMEKVPMLIPLKIKIKKIKFDKIT